MLFGEYIRLMALVEYSADEIKTVFSDFPDLEVCVYAAPTQTVIGGPPEQVDAIIARAESEGKFARKFQTKGASHTQQMDPLLGELAAELQGIKPMSPTAGIYSTVHEGSYIKPGGDPIHDVDYWKKGLRHSVYFTHGIRNAVDSGHTTFLELAPNPVALMQVGLTTAAAGLHDAQLIPTLARKQDEVESMISTMAQLYVYGHDLDIRTLFTRAGGPEDYANIPPTRFKRKEHWLDVSLLRRQQLSDHAGRPRRAAGRPPRLGVHASEIYGSGGGDGSGGAGESRCGRSASGRAIDGLGAARGAGRGRPAGDDADAAPGRRLDSGACPHRRILHAAVRRAGFAGGSRVGVACRGGRRHGDRAFSGNGRSNRGTRGGARRGPGRRNAGRQPDQPLHADRHDQMVTGLRRDHRRAAGHDRRARRWVTSPRTCRGRCRSSSWAWTR